MSQSRNSRRFFFLTILTVSIAVPLLVHADGLTPDDQAFFDKHASDVVQLQPTKLSDPSFLKVFSTPFYAVKVVIKEGDGDETTELVVAKMGDKLVSVSRPDTDMDLPDFPKLLNPDFRLKTDDDAKALQSALDAAYPIIGDDNKKVEAIRHTGNQWIMVRGAFFDKTMGYTFDVDADGVIKSVKYVLKLP